MYSSNHGYIRGQAYGRGTPLERGYRWDFCQPGYVQSMCPLAEYAETDDYAKYEEGNMKYDHYEEYEMWHGGRATDCYLNPFTGGYDDVQESPHLADGAGDFGQGNSQRAGHVYYDPLHHGSTCYEMQHKKRKRIGMQGHQKQGKCFARKEDVPWSGYSKWKEPIKSSNMSSKMNTRKFGIQRKGTHEFEARGKAPLNNLVEDKMRHKDASTMTHKSEDPLNALQKLESEIEEMKDKLELIKCESDNKVLALEKQIDELRKQLQDKMDEMDFVESSNQVLVIKERQSNGELQEIQKELINGFLEHGCARAHIGIKRMGELDLKAFSNACKQILPQDNADVTAAILCSRWEAEIKKKTLNGTLLRLSRLVEKRRR